jgi:hypothetical protein
VNEPRPLARRSDQLGRKTENVRQDWRRKRADPGVPAVVPERREDGDPLTGRRLGASRRDDGNAPGRIRTCGLRLRRAALYPLSYRR